MPSHSRVQHNGLHTPLLSRADGDLESGARPDSPGVLRLLAESRSEAGTLVLATIFLLIGALANLAVPKVGGESTQQVGCRTGTAEGCMRL